VAAPAGGGGKQPAAGGLWRPKTGGKRETRRVAGLRVLRWLEHDTAAFTQGLVVHRGELFESTGMYGHGTVRVLDPVNGAVTKQVELDPKLFGEGLAGLGDMLVLLTWREQTGKVFEAATLDEVQTFKYDGRTSTNEGWGVTHDGSHFVVSDGSDKLHSWNAEDVFAGTLRKVGTTAVRYPDGRPATLLNELEWIPDAGGVVLANVWYQDVIVAIDPATGYVLHTYDFGRLHPKRGPREDCFNGIALNATARTLILTGKYWPRMYVVDFPDQTAVYAAARAALPAAVPPE